MLKCQGIDLTNDKAFDLWNNFSTNIQFVSWEDMTSYSDYQLSILLPMLYKGQVEDELDLPNLIDKQYISKRLHINQIKKVDDILWCFLERLITEYDNSSDTKTNALDKVLIDFRNYIEKQLL